MKLSSRKKLTATLGVSCAVMMLFLLVQRQFGLGSTYSTLPDMPPAVESASEAPQSEFEPDMASEGAFLEINDRSLFTQTRTAPPEFVPPPPPVAEVPKVPLTAQLTGVVITPTRKVALLRSAGGDQTYRLREGMPFPGELAGWRVTQINARSVVFDGGATQGQVELKLDVAKGSPMSGLPAIPQVPGNSPVPPMSDNSKFNTAAIPMPVPGALPPAPPPPSADQAAREMEVQRIIEERRAQMRAEAERMSSGNQ